MNQALDAPQQTAHSPLRVGIIGVDNGHAHAFAHILNGWSHRVPPPLKFSKDGEIDTAAWLWSEGIWVHETYASASLARNRMHVCKIFGEEEAQAKLIADACGIETVASSAEECSEDVDVILVLSGSGPDHFEHARHGLARGIPVYIDKPMSDSVSEACRIFEFAQKHGAVVFSASSFRFAPKLNALSRELPNLVGDLRALHIQCPERMRDYSIHGLEMINVFMRSEIASVQAISAGQHDVALYEFEDGRTAALEHIKLPGHLRYNGVFHGSLAIERYAFEGIAQVFIALLNAIAAFAETRVAPVQPEETISLIRAFEATRQALESGGKVKLS